MNPFIQKYGRWALVAGSAEGLGEAFSELLAAKKMNILMVDNKPERNMKLASRLENTYKIKTMCIDLDLADIHADEILMRSVAENDCHLLVYNAAYSRVNPFISSSRNELEKYIDVNTRTVLKVTHAFSVYLIRENRGGGIILMSSLAGLFGSELVVPYGATKAFIRILSEGLYYELKRNSIDVIACCAGPAATPGFYNSGPSMSYFSPKPMNPMRVAGICLNKLGKTATCIPGIRNRVNYFILNRLLPRKVSAKLVNRVMRGMYRDTCINQI